MPNFITLLKSYTASPDRTVRRHSIALLKRLQELNPQDECDCNKNYGTQLSGAHDISCKSRII